MFAKISQKLGIDYLKDEIGKTKEFAEIIKAPYGLNYFQMIDLCYNYLSPYQSERNEAKRVQKVSNNLFGKQAFDAYNIHSGVVEWNKVFAKAVKKFIELQFDEQFESYFIVCDKIKEINGTMKKAKATSEKGVKVITDCAEALKMLDDRKQQLSDIIFPYLKLKQDRIGGDKELSWAERHYLSEKDSEEEEVVTEELDEEEWEDKTESDESEDT